MSAHIKPIGWVRLQDGLEYAPVMVLYAMKPAPENGAEPVEMYSRDQVELMLAAHPKDTVAIIEIDKVMLESGAHWPDVEADALVVRHVKELTRMLNAERAAIQAMRDQVRLAYMSGTGDFRRFYDAELFHALGIDSFRDLYAPAGSVPSPIAQAVQP